MELNKFRIFWTQSTLGPKNKAGMDATISDGSYATILSNGSAGMPQKFIDFDIFLMETSFLRPP